jgi:uncharacterized protein YodC (DUF2158 family)
MTDFAPGDVVRLKSGGPAMTIDGIENGHCVCLWFGNDNMELQRRHIMPHVLSLVTPESRPAARIPGKR